MTSMMHKKRSIEVGCGPGRHSLMLASTFLRRDGGVLVSCDFSNWMV
jgi:ubiquinone/menaquinone biosynthesis C-methylase UbiE